MDAVMLNVARQVLGVPDLTETDDLFEAGMTSLAALALADRLTSVLGREIAVADIYHAATLDRIRDLDSVAVVLPPAPPSDPHLPSAVSRAQRRFWLAEQYFPAACDNMLVLAYTITGPLRPEVLHRAFADLVTRHAILRTRYLRQDGDVVQEVMSAEAADIVIESVERVGGDVDPGSLARHMTADWWEEPFELDRRPPLQARLTSIDDETHLLCVRIHHIAFDGRSERLFIGDLCEFYRARLSGRPAPARPPNAGTYVDHVRRGGTMGTDEADLSFWERTLSNAPPPFLPPPADPMAEADRREIVRRIPVTTVDRLQLAVRKRRAPALAALAAATARSFADVFCISDMCVGAITEGRTRAADYGVIGYFVNPMAIPVRMVGERGTADLLDHAASQLLGALEHSRVPFDELVRLLRPQRARHPWFQALVALQYEPPRGELAGGTTIQSIRVPPPRTATEFSVQAFPVPDGSWDLQVSWRVDGCSEAMGKAVVDGVVTALDRIADLSR